ncbi:MAG: nicotinate (nicotinamide) nucleotide adenylyltransferase [Phycisphaerae bacterium]
MHTLIYGGTFDPIHHAHLLTALRAREILHADKVLFIPAHISPHKTHRRSASAEHRLNMLHLALADHAYFLADARELDRGERTGTPSYTIDTIESLRAENPADTYTLLLGADQLPALHTWHRIGELVDLIDLAVLGRPTPPNLPYPPPYPLQAPATIAPTPPQSPSETAPKPSKTVPKPSETVPNPLQIGLDSVQKHLGPIVAARLQFLHTPLIEISSTDIRERVRQGLPLDFFLPRPVIDYIHKNNLYRND